MKRAAIVAGTVAAVLAGTAAAPAGAADECNGLRVCLPVSGPWVAVAQGGAEYELRCPRQGYIVAGTDARLASRDIDVSFRGETGSPVAPGVTTRAAVLFRAISTGTTPTSFRPFIGCIPTAAAVAVPDRGGGDSAGRRAADATAADRRGHTIRRSWGLGRAGPVPVRSPARRRRARRRVSSREPAVGRRARRGARPPVPLPTVRSSSPCGSPARSRRPPGGPGASPVPEGTVTFGSPLLLLTARGARRRRRCLRLARPAPAAGSCRLPQPRSSRCRGDPIRELEAARRSGVAHSARSPRLCVGVARPRLPSRRRPTAPPWFSSSTSPCR